SLPRHPRWDCQTRCGAAQAVTKTHSELISKRFHHEMVGELALSYESFTVNGVPGQTLIVYQAEPGSPSDRALSLLGSLTAADPTGADSPPPTATPPNQVIDTTPG
ncbi:hypothetical protein ABZV91_29070, partial [Nocardia sp. NPDC004568]